MASVLIVDDEFGLAEMTGELLVIAGYRVATAINGKLALASLNQMRPDLILLDVMMPIMSGPEMLAALKADPRYRDIPVIMMSAVGPSAIEESSLALLAGFLQKPFTYDQLMVAINAALPSP
jgi:CheY-like chemotaxis protein